MAGRIPESFIDDLLARADIVDLINQRVPLRKAGHEFKACCPFHDEKTPSFTVSPTKQFYHCFGCGAHGSALGFLMEYERLEFVEAVQALADHLGVEVPRENGGSAQRGPDRKPLYEVLERCTRFYEEQLRHHRDAARAIDYLRQRGLSGEMAGRFRLGYAPPGWSNLLDALGTSSHARAQLAEAGLLSEGDRGSYDRFRDRIIFPILDTRGRVVAFGGRVLDDSKPKYLNSPETPVFHKGRELYGLHQAKQANSELPRLLIVEGYMDVIALAQHGLPEAVATLGTATTADHLDKLFRSTQELVFCFDGDRAGRQAAWKALETALPFMRDGREVRFLLLPDGEDPDTLIRAEGQAGLQQRIQQAIPLADHLFAQLSQQAPGHSLAQRARLVQLARPHLDRIPRGVFRDLLEDRLARESATTGLSVGAAGATSSARRSGRRPAQEGLVTMTPIRRAIALLGQNPALAQDPTLPGGWETLEQPGIELLASLLASLRAHPHLTTGALVERADEAHRRALAKLAVVQFEHRDDAAEQLRAILSRLASQTGTREAAQLQQRFRPSALSDEEKQRLRALYQRRGTPNTEQN